MCKNVPLESISISFQNQKANSPASLTKVHLDKKRISRFSPTYARIAKYLFSATVVCARVVESFSIFSVAYFFLFVNTKRRDALAPRPFRLIAF